MKNAGLARDVGFSAMALSSDTNNLFSVWTGTGMCFKASDRVPLFGFSVEHVE